MFAARVPNSVASISIHQMTPILGSIREMLAGAFPSPSVPRLP